MPLQYSKTELWSGSTKIKIATIAPNAKKRGFILLHSFDCVYAVTYSEWLSSSASRHCVPNVGSQYLNAQQLCIKYVYGYVHARAPHWISFDYNLEGPDCAKVTGSTQVCKHDKLYQLNTLQSGKGRWVTVLTPGTFTNSLKKETSFQMHIPRETLLDIAQMDHEAHKIFLSKPLPASMKNSAAKLRPNSQVWRDLDHSKRYPKNRNCIFMPT